MKKGGIYPLDSGAGEFRHSRTGPVATEGSLWYPDIRHKQVPLNNNAVCGNEHC